MEKQNKTIKVLQLGINLLFNKGGIYQAVRDYQEALGGAMCSLLDPMEAQHGMVDEINYRLLGADPLSRLAGRANHSAKIKLLSDLEEASHIFLHGSYRLTAAYALEACSYSPEDKALFYIPHGSLDPWVFEKRGFIKRLWLRHYGRRLFDDSRAVLAMTHNELKKIQKLAGTRHNQRVIYLPLDLQQCQVTRAASDTRSKYGIPTDVRLICYLGRLHDMKRPLETIDAVLAASKQLHLVVIGPDDTITSNQLRQYVDRYGARDRIHIIGPVYGVDKYNLLGACDAYISLSHRENFNYTAAEAMGMKRPVILSPGNDLQGEISQIDCGWMLRSLDATEIMACLSDFLETSDRQLAEMGQRGRCWVEENLSFDHFKDSLFSLL